MAPLLTPRGHSRTRGPPAVPPTVAMRPLPPIASMPPRHFPGHRVGVGMHNHGWCGTPFMRTTGTRTAGALRDPSSRDEGGKRHPTDSHEAPRTCIAHDDIIPRARRTNKRSPIHLPWRPAFTVETNPSYISNRPSPSGLPTRPHDIGSQLRPPSVKWN